MNVLEKIGLTGLVPVVVINDAEDAVPAAKALLKGGLDIMEITMRTEAGIQAIKNVADDLPEMLVGAGTVLTYRRLVRGKRGRCDARMRHTHGDRSRIELWGEYS